MSVKIDYCFGERKTGVSYTDREGAYLLAVRDGLLAVVRTAAGLFLPGGGIESGESHEACILRECLEETGRPAEAGGYLATAESYAFHEKIGWFHPIQHYYAGALGAAVQEAIEADHEFLWVPEEEAAEAMRLEIQRWAVRRCLASRR